MRKDMGKVVVEKERRGSSNPNKPLRGRTKKAQKAWKNEGEGFSKFESSARRRRYGYDAKQFGENLGPLKKFLTSRVGSKWDDVYSELCSVLSKDSVTQSHVLDHAKWYVEQNVFGFDADGIPLNERGFSVYEIFYVDADGILQKTPRKKRQKRLPEKTYVRINDILYGKRSDGLWYRLFFDIVPEPDYRRIEEMFWGKLKMFRRRVNDKVFDKWIGDYVYSPRNSPWKNGMYCTKFEQISKKELRLIKKVLENG